MTMAQDSASGDEEGSKQSTQKANFWGKLFARKMAEPPHQSVRQTDQLALNIATLRDKRIADIGTPKADITSLSLSTDVDTFFEVLRESGYSRLPVYNDTLDDPVGLVHVKDVFMAYGLDGAVDKFSLEPFLRPLIFVPPSMRVVTLLQKMQTEHVHMALVIDEFGGVDGLVTIEDIIEEIVGEITDEHDEAEDLWTQEKPNVYNVRAWAEIEAFEQDVGVKLPTEDEQDEVDTIGGYVVTLVSRVPTKGEVIKHESGFEFEIIDADPRRIKRIRIRLPQPAFEK